jgi:spore germination cell wall hydrolase CwlJ-like protein
MRIQIDKISKLTADDRAALSRMIYGEAAGADEATMKMIAQTAINRLLSGRTKEFGGNLTRVLQKGYYAVKNPNKPYKQALSGQFNDELSKRKWAQAQRVVNDILENNDFGNAQFYFTPLEIERLKKSGDFDFSLVIPTGRVGNYETFSYPETVSHYRK